VRAGIGSSGVLPRVSAIVHHGGGTAAAAPSRPWTARATPSRRCCL